MIIPAPTPKRALTTSSSHREDVYKRQETPSLKSIKANGAEALEKLDCWQTGISTIDVSELKHLDVYKRQGRERFEINKTPLLRFF